MPPQAVVGTPSSAWVAIAVGGALGSVLRHGVGLLVQRGIPGFPWGTFVINVTGSFLLGFLARALGGDDVHPSLRAALTIGLCGGYTTFSTFSFETMRLAADGLGARAATYVVASVLLSLAAVFAGTALARVIR
ncbi:MAG: fluoride efflux transporter CrcB [Gemmatimonadetes bacterium]|nr:fluoride efflux transporter CrcB [Gemmatimonadota bacterium]